MCIQSILFNYNFSILGRQLEFLEFLLVYSNIEYSNIKSLSKSNLKTCFV